jgi:hypothetical protein
MEVSGLYRPEIIQYSNGIYGINWLVGGAITILKNMKVNGKVKNYPTYMNLIFFQMFHISHISGLKLSQ